jgi:hypothetical protein
MNDCTSPAALDFIPTDLRSPSEVPEFAELSLLLPHWQIDALESAARGRGLTTAQMLRRLIADTFSGLGPAGVAAV